MKRSESENLSLHTNLTTMRGGHNGTLPRNKKTSQTTPSDEAFPLQPVTAIQLTPPNSNSPPSHPASRSSSSSSASYRRPTSRLSFSGSAFGDYGSINEHSSPSHLSPPQPLGLARPKGMCTRRIRLGLKVCWGKLERPVLTGGRSYFPQLWDIMEREGLNK